MTKEEIEKINNIDIPFETLEMIYNDVESNLNKFIKNESIKYKKKVEINYRNPWSINEKYIHNAYAGKIIGYDNKYEIYICPLLIKDLFKFAHFIAGYKHFKIKNTESERQIFAYHLMYLWIYFISLHEYSHIISGHVDYDTNSQTIFEFIDISALSSEELIIKQAMELEADSTASLLFFGSFLSAKENINKIFKNKQTDKDIIFNYLLGINFLFHFFDSKPRNKTKPQTHPLGTERALFFNGSILKKITEFSKKTNLKEEEFQLIGSLALIQYLNYIGLTNQEIPNVLIEFMKKMKVFDTHKVRDKYKKYRLLK